MKLKFRITGKMHNNLPKKVYTCARKNDDQMSRISQKKNLTTVFTYSAKINSKTILNTFQKKLFTIYTIELKFCVTGKAKTIYLRLS